MSCVNYYFSVDYKIFVISSRLFDECLFSCANWTVVNITRFSIYISNKRQLKNFLRR